MWSIGVRFYKAVVSQLDKSRSTIGGHNRTTPSPLASRIHDLIVAPVSSSSVPASGQFLEGTPAQVLAQQGAGQGIGHSALSLIQVGTLWKRVANGPGLEK